MNKPLSISPHVGLLAVFLGFLPYSSRASSRTWDNGNGNNNWGTAANWNPDGLPVNGDTLVFVAGQISSNNNLSGLSLHDLDFNARHTLTGNAFTLTNGITATTGINPITINPQITLGDDQSFDVAGGSLVCAGTVDLNGNQLSVPGAATLVLDGIVSGTGIKTRLDKSGLGTLRIGTSAIANNAGGIRLQDGTLDVLGFVLAGNLNMTGGRLTGDGTLNSISATGGEIEPGAADLSVTGSVTLNSSVKCIFELTAPGAESQLACSSTVNLGGAQLEVKLAAGFTPSFGEIYQVVTKSPAGAITGTFTGYPDDSEVILGSTVGRIHYDGGNGNDVTIEIISVTKTWDGGATLNDDWQDGDNWNANTVPHAGDALVFGPANDTDKDINNDFPDYTTFRSLYFPSANYTIRGAPLQLSHGLISNNNDVDFDTSVRLSLNQTWELGERITSNSVTTSKLHFDLLDEIETNGRVLTFRGFGEIEGAIRGSGSIVVETDSIYEFLDDNDYTGLTTVQADASLRITSVTGLGTAASGTTVHGKLRGYFSGVGDHTFTEPLSLTGNGLLDFTASDPIDLRGAIHLSGGESPQLMIDAQDSQISSVISSTGASQLVIKSDSGSDRIRLTGSASNTWSGILAVDSCTLILDKDAGRISVPCAQVRVQQILGSAPPILQLDQNEQIADDCVVEIKDGLFLLNSLVPGSTGHTETIGGLQMRGGTIVNGLASSLLILDGPLTSSGMDLNPTDDATSEISAPLRVDASPCDLAVSQVTAATDFQFLSTVTRSGTGSLRKTGPGRAVFASTTTLPCELVQGETFFNGNASGSPITLNGGILGGGGTVGAISSLAGGGTVAPGQSLGTLTSGSLLWNATTHFQVEIGVFNLGNGFDKLNVTGTVNLGNAILDLVLLPTFGVPNGTQLILINNDGSDPITGQFAGRPDGSFIPLSSGGFLLSYRGTDGTGNDVVLTKVAVEPPSPRILTIAFSKGTGPGGQDQVTLTGTAPPSTTLTVQVSTNLTTWSNLQTVNSNPAGAVSLTINQTPGIPRRFLRLKP